jgi:hypothetical protein
VRAALPITHRFRSRGDVENFWRAVRNVPARSRRAKRDEERYALALFLRARADHGLLRYAVLVTEGQSPDFMIRECGGHSAGLEVTRATSPEIQKWMTEAEKRLPEISSVLLSQAGWAGDSVELEWLQLFECAIRAKVAKLAKFRHAHRHDLLVYDDTPLPSPDRNLVIPELTRYVRAQREKQPLLGRVSVIMSLDVIYDVAGVCRVLPFIDWNAPDRSHDLGERVEYAAQHAIMKELRGTSSR